MGAFGWGTDHPVGEWLFEEGYRFDFFQAVRLLETMFSEGVRVGEGADPERESVRFTSQADLAFPATDIAEIQPLDATLKQVGLTFSDLTPQLARQVGLDEDDKGVVITYVNPASIAFREAKLRPWMCITEIIPSSDGEDSRPVPVFSVQNVRQLEEVYQTLEPGASFLMRVTLTRERGTKLVELTKPESRRALMRVNFLGLAGHLGPLPAPYTELIMDRAWQRDTAFRDFLDIFNHRLVSLLYRVRKHHHIGLDIVAPDQSHVASYLYALAGMGTPGLKERMGVDDRALLRYTGLLTQKPRSALGLEAILKDYFHVPVRVRQYVGRWRALEDHQTTYIASSEGNGAVPGYGPSQNNSLGHNVVLGSHVWQQAGQIELHVGLLGLPEFLDFLPIGSAHHALSELTRFYVNQDADFNIVLKLKPEEVPASRLSMVMGPRLGWTSWLGMPAADDYDDRPDEPGKTTRLPATFEVTVTPPLLPPELQKLRIPLLADLSPDQLRTVRRAMKLRRRAEGEVVAQQGKAATSVYIITAGSVHVLRAEPGKSDVLLSTLTEGDFFGEATLQEDKQYLATFVAAEPSEILELTHRQLRQVMEQYPAVARTIELYRRKKGLDGGASPYEKLARKLQALRSPLFAGLPMDGLCEVAEQITLFSLPPGTLVVRQGDLSKALYVISKGTARVDVRLPDGNIETVATLRKGDFLGEMEMFYGERNFATVTTIRPVEVIELTYAVLARIIARYPPVEHVLRVLHHRRFTTLD